MVDAKSPFIGVLMLNTSFPRLKGDIGCKETFPFPIKYLVVDNANSGNVVVNPSSDLLDSFILAAQKMENEGACAIVTSCGFLACFQKELSNSVSIPVGSSSILLAPLISRMIGSNRTIGIMTARASSLTPSHFSSCDSSDVKMDIEGMEGTEFYRVYVNNEVDFDADVLSEELAERALQLKKRNDELGAILLECTNMPPFSGLLRKRIKVPVFDIRHLTWLLYASVNGIDRGTV